MAFRLDEPVPHIYEPGIANTIAEGSVFVKEDGSWWRERRQGDVLASGDVSEFSANIDFAKLASRLVDESLVPKAGHLDRIMASHHNLGQGVDYNITCLTSTAPECTGRFVGQLQPYAAFVPAKASPRHGCGLVVRSPITSSTSCPNSISIPGAATPIRWRRSSAISSPVRWRALLRRRT